MTLAVNAAVVSHNIGELNACLQRGGPIDPDHPLLRCATHVHGFTMLTKNQADELDAEYAEWVA